MPFDSDPDSPGLSRALRDAADSFAPPSPEIQYAQAVERGRRIRRHGSVLTGVGSALMVAVAGTLAFPYLSHHNESVGAAAGQQQQTFQAGPATAPPTASVSISAITGDYMIQNVLAALPASIAMSVVSGDLATGSAPSVDAAAGYWVALAQWSIANPDGSTAYSFAVEYPTAASLDSCLGELVAAPHDTCIETPMDGGVLVLDKTRTDPASETGQYIWKYTWVRADGREEYLSEDATTPSGLALSTPQVTTLLTAQAWNVVADALPPAVCPTQMRTGLTSNGSVSGAVLHQLYTCPDNGATVQVTAS